MYEKGPKVGRQGSNQDQTRDKDREPPWSERNKDWHYVLD